MGDIEKQYTNLRNPGAFSGRSGFIRNSKVKDYPPYVKKELTKIPAYTLHVRVPKRIKRRRVYTWGIDYQWQMDLLDIRKHSKSNYRKNYIVCVIDCFSKKAWIEAISHKTAEIVLITFKNIIKRSKRTCEHLQTDDGTEFFNAKMKAFCKEKDIIHFSVTTPMKASIAERFIRTISEKISRYMTHYKTKRFVHKLRDFERLYNNSYHRSIKMKPVQVSKDNEAEVWQNLYGQEPSQSKQKSFKVGDRVLKSRTKAIFEKGHSKFFDDKVHYIRAVVQSDPPLYFLKDESGKSIKRGYYRQEIQKIE